MNRTAVLIIDSGDIGHLRREIAAGTMPNLAAMLDASTFMPLRATTTHRSEMVWARFFTGLPERDQGYYGQWQFSPSEYTTFGKGASNAPTFWTRDPVPSIVVDVIHSAPQRALPGGQIFGWGTHSPQFKRSAVPAGRFEDAVAAVGYSPMFNNDHPLGWFDPTYIQALETAAVASLGQRGELHRFMQAKTPDWQFMLGCVSEYHGVAHHAWHGVDPHHILHRTKSATAAKSAMDAVVSALDRQVGEFVEGAGDATVVMGAHHGFQMADDLLISVVLPELIFRHLTGKTGFRDSNQAEWKAQGMAPIELPPGTNWTTYARRSFVPSVRDYPRAAISHVPQSWYENVRRLTGAKARPKLGEFTSYEHEEWDLDDPKSWVTHQILDHEVPHWYRSYWPSMPWFAIPSFDDGRIRVNLKGREANGIVDPANYESTLGEIEAFVRGIRDPRTGQPLVREVFFDRQHDPFELPGPDADVVVRFDSASDAGNHPEVGMVGPFPFMRTASHRENGWMAVRGSGAERGAVLAERPGLAMSHIVDALRRGKQFDQALTGVDR